MAVRWMIPLAVGCALTGCKSSKPGGKDAGAPAIADAVAVPPAHDARAMSGDEGAARVGAASSQNRARVTLVVARHVDGMHPRARSPAHAAMQGRLRSYTHRFGKRRTQASQDPPINDRRARVQLSCLALFLALCGAPAWTRHSTHAARGDVGGRRLSDSDE